MSNSEKCGSKPTREPRAVGNIKLPLGSIEVVTEYAPSLYQKIHTPKHSFLGTTLGDSSVGTPYQ